METLNTIEQAVIFILAVLLTTLVGLLVMVYFRHGRIERDLETLREQLNKTDAQ